jgi:hypothetical protein
VSRKNLYTQREGVNGEYSEMPGNTKPGLNPSTFETKPKQNVAADLKI